MNREKVNKFFDDLEFIESYCKKFEPDFKINLVLTGWVNGFEDLHYAFEGFDMEYCEEGNIYLYFFSRRKNGILVRWGTSELDEDECLRNNLTTSSYNDVLDRYDIDYLKIFDYIVKKIKNNKFTIDLKDFVLKDE